MTNSYNQFNMYELNNMIMQEESSSQNYNYYNKYHNNANSEVNLFEFCPEIKQLRENLKTYQNLNATIIKWYESVIRECVHQNDQHKKSYEEIEGLLNLNQPQLQKIIVERNITPVKLNNLKLMLDEYTSIHYTSQLEQVQNQLEVYQRKNRDLTGFMKCWNTDSMMEYSFTKRLLTPQFAKEWSEKCKIFKNGKIVKVQDDLQKPCFSIVEPTIESRKKKNQKLITFKVLNVPNKFLYLGVVKIKTAQECNFVFDRKLGKGAYVIAGHTGYSFSNDFQDQNFKATSFKFLSNDIVTLEYDPISMKVNFVNQTRNLKTSLRVKQETTDDPLHFCAVVFHQGTQIEIIASEEV